MARQKTANPAFVTSEVQKLQLASVSVKLLRNMAELQENSGDDLDREIAMLGDADADPQDTLETDEVAVASQANSGKSLAKPKAKPAQATNRRASGRNKTATSTTTAATPANTGEEIVNTGVATGKKKAATRNTGAAPKHTGDSSKGVGVIDSAIIAKLPSQIAKGLQAKATRDVVGSSLVSAVEELANKEQELKSAEKRLKDVEDSLAKAQKEYKSLEKRAMGSQKFLQKQLKTFEKSHTNPASSAAAPVKRQRVLESDSDTTARSKKRKAVVSDAMVIDDSDSENPNVFLASPPTSSKKRGPPSLKTFLPRAGATKMVSYQMVCVLRCLTNVPLL